jgi:lysophospholipase L1-like esterase
LVKNKLQTDRKISQVKYSILLFSFLVFTEQRTKAQNADDFLSTTNYPFINYTHNYFQNTEYNPYFISFYDKIDSLIRFGDRKINILHIGGSHIQADIYTNQIRKRLLQIGPDMNAGRGLIFPVKMAHTNNPSNFSVNYTGNWTYSKCTRAEDKDTLGLTGFSVTTNDSAGSIIINPNRDSMVRYTFNYVRIFHSPSHYRLTIKSKDSTYYGNYLKTLGYTEFNLADQQEILNLKLTRDSVNDSFTLYGISIENDASGIIYNSIGVNGAMLSSYLHCSLFTEQLKAVSPDLVIFSIGTNEGNTVHFDSLSYIDNYRKLINLVHNSLPGMAILLTVPNDCYYMKKYTNKNTAVIRKIIYNLAEENHCGIWDFYEIMGGYNSSQVWYSYKLMNTDRIHFNRDGYLLKGDLLFSAFLKSWDFHLEQSPSLSKLEKSKILPAQTAIR